MSSALGLVRLQQVDTRIDQVEAELVRIRESLANDSGVRTAQTAYETAEGIVRQAETSRRSTEQQAEAVRLKMQQAEASLYGGSVRNPKELQDLQAEIASLKRHLLSIEETELHWMEELETAEERLRQARDRLQQVLADRNATAGQLTTRDAELVHNSEALRAEREAAAGAVAGPHLEIYEQLRHARRGVAVAVVADGACGACGTTLTAAHQQAARHAPELVLCPSCGRILYGES